MNHFLKHLKNLIDTTVHKTIEAMPTDDESASKLIEKTLWHFALDFNRLMHETREKK